MTAPKNGASPKPQCALLQDLVAPTKIEPNSTHIPEAR